MKLFVAVFLAVFVVAFGRTVYKGDNKIVGGKETTIEEYPYQVSLQYGPLHFCGGSILNEDTILTACHCIENAGKDDFVVKAGVTKFYENVEVLKIAEIIKHPECNEGLRFNNDVAILKLASKLTFSDKIQPIKLTTEAVPDDTTAFVSGWGAKNYGGDPSPILRAVDVNVINHEKCKEMNGAENISDNMLCAAGPRKDACTKDSGGPLTVDGKLIGVVSFGMGCGIPGKPGVYADVSILREFITENM